MPFLRGQDFPGERFSCKYGDYARIRHILRGDHAAAWTAKQAVTSASESYDYGRDPQYKAMVDSLDSQISVVVNLPRVIERKFASLTIRGLKIAAVGDKAQSAIDATLKASGGAPLLHRCAYRMGGYGNAVVTVSRGAGGVRINPRDPWTWFPEVDRADASRVERHVFAWRQSHEGREYLLQEIHEAGRIVRLANALIGVRGSEKLGKETTWAALGFDPSVYKPEERTGVDAPLVAVWSNITDDESVYGDSDLLGNEAMANEVTSRLSQIARILDKHADPKMQGPEGAQKIDPLTSAVKFDISGSRFFPRSSSEDPPYEYLTWNAQLAEAFGQFDRAVKLLCVCMEMAPALIGLEEGAGVESSQSLRIRAINTVDAVEAKRLFATQGIADTARLVLALSGAKDADVAVSYGDVLPLTKQEIADSVVAQHSSGLRSRQKSIAELNPSWSEEDVVAEVERISDEEAGVLNPGMA